MQRCLAALTPPLAHPHEIQHEHRDGNPAAFRWSVLLNSGLSGLQLAIGIGFGSLALIGDALHNLGDVAGLLLGWGAERLSALPASRQFTSGFGRSTQLASIPGQACANFLGEISRSRTNRTNPCQPSRYVSRSRRP